jgi:hypothetical protein
MTTKSVLRLLIGIAIAALLIVGLLPFAGLPRAQMLPPPMIYNQATGKAIGYVHAKKQEEGSNPFKVGEPIWRIDYQFRAKTPPTLGAKDVGKNNVYKGTTYVTRSIYDAYPVGSQIKVRYETTYPVISGIDLPGAGRSVAPGSKMMSGWILFAIGTIVLGYCIAPLLERIMLRENF